MTFWLGVIPETGWSVKTLFNRRKETRHHWQWLSRQWKQQDRGLWCRNELKKRNVNRAFVSAGKIRRESSGKQIAMRYRDKSSHRRCGGSHSHQIFSKGQAYSPKIARGNFSIKHVFSLGGHRGELKITMKQMHLKNQRFVWNANKHFALIDKHMLIFINVCWSSLCILTLR